MPAIDSYQAILILLTQISNKCDVIVEKLDALLSSRDGDSSAEDTMDEDEAPTQEFDDKASSSPTVKWSSSNGPQSPKSK